MLDKSTLTSLKDSNVSAEEIAKFDALAESWWDPNGKYKTALAFNRARVEYFIDKICEVHNRNKDKIKPLEGLRVLDVGCGGGLVSEAMAKAGATVTGIDASELSVQVAKRHALKSELEIDYIHAHAQQFLETAPEPFDVVINAEVIEHVPNQKELVQQCSKLCRVDGCVVMATLNRTVKSFVVGIIGAEYIMRYLPRGTHSWHLFVTPFELNSMASIARMKLVAESGMAFNPLSKQWRLSTSLGVNYIQVYQKLGNIRDS